jgi:cytochrome c553
MDQREVQVFPSRSMIFAAGLFAAGLFAAPVVSAADPVKEHKFNPLTASQIMQVCATCHGEFGQGGGGGVYPRLAGLPKDYIAEQLRKFKSQERDNIPMIPFATERELPEPDIQDISIHLSQIVLPTKVPPQDGQMDGYERLVQVKKVLNIPRYEGDVKAGKEVYEDCSSCHGRKGEGKGKYPLLAGQFSNYLLDQMKAFKAGTRHHEQAKAFFADMTDEQMRDMLAYLSILDDE